MSTDPVHTAHVSIQVENPAFILALSKNAGIERQLAIKAFVPFAEVARLLRVIADEIDAGRGHIVHEELPHD